MNNKISVLIPELPKSDKIVPYLNKIDSSHWYTNFGPLLVSFEQRLADLFRVDSKNIATANNATVALSLALANFDFISDKKKYCVVPSWTFIATPLAVLNAGFIPVFADVDFGTWQLTPEKVFQCLKELSICISEVHAVVPVCAFGQPIEYEQWITFLQQTGVHVLIDAAASFDSVQQSALPVNCEIPLVISLHATKTLGVGEGSLVISRNQDFILNFKKRTNFGFWGSRNSLLVGTNAKLSEYVAAVGLAALDNWLIKKKQWEVTRDNYLRHEKQLNLKKIKYFGLSRDWVSSYCHVLFEDPKQLILAKNNLAKKEVEFRSWWSEGCHKHFSMQSCKKATLTETNKLGELSLGIPFHTKLKDEEIGFICNIICE